MQSKATSVTFEPPLLKRLDRIAGAMNRPRSWLIGQAVEEYLKREERIMAAIQEGVDAADDGRVVDHDRVRRWVGSWNTDEELERPRCG